MNHRSPCVVGAIALVYGLAIGLATGHAQTPTTLAPQIDRATVVRFVAATSDEARVVLLADIPALSGESGHSAFIDYGEELAGRRRFPEARRAYQALEWLATHLQRDRLLASALTGLAAVEGRRGNLIESEALSTRALAIVDRIGDPGFAQPVVANLAVVQRRLGDWDAAAASLDRALALARELKRVDSESRVYNNIGLLQWNLGNAKLAQEYFSKSLELKVDDGARGTLDIATTLNNIGALYEEQADFRQALMHFEMAVEHIERAGGGARVSTPLLNVGHAQAALGQPALARATYERVLALATASKDGRIEATALYNLANVDRDEGRLVEAIELQRRSLALREAGGDAVAVTDNLSALASLMLQLSRPAEAETLAARAVSIAEEIGLFNPLARAQLYLGQAYAMQGQEAEALRAYESSVDAVEWLRERTTGGEQARQVFLSTRTGPFLAMAELHAKAGRGFEALMTVERARARTLLDILAVGKQPTRSMTEAERATERRLAKTVLTASLQLAAERQQPDPHASHLETLRKVLSDARLAREAFVSTLYAGRPNLRLIRGDAPVISQAQLEKILKPGTGVVEFVVIGGSVWVFVVTPDEAGPNIVVQRLEMATAELLRLSEEFSRQVATRDLSFADNSRRLYGALFGQLDGRLARVKHLIVVPDAELWRVPFQALETPRGAYLVEERALSYAPSLSALAALDERQTTRADGAAPFLVALGDPASTSTLEASQRGVASGPLPEASREVTELARLYGQEQSRTFVGAAASEGALRASIAQASVLHIATHGVLDDLSPMYSHLVLVPESTIDSRADGRLEARELLDLDLSADLVVLSACQTASGLVGRGEGVIGLSWALLASGASTAVLSQWEVDSASTTRLMIAFHTRLLSNGSSPIAPADALRSAAVGLMKAPRYRHPFYWAGFIAIGR